jgi:hypothetical protein
MSWCWVHEISGLPRPAAQSGRAVAGYAALAGIGHGAPLIQGRRSGWQLITAATSLITATTGICPWQKSRHIVGRPAWPKLLSQASGICWPILGCVDDHRGGESLPGSRSADPPSHAGQRSRMARSAVRVSGDQFGGDRTWATAEVNNGSGRKLEGGNVEAESWVSLRLLLSVLLE